MKVNIFLLALFMVAQVARADSGTRIYECIVNGEHVFSDHVCADNAIERNVTVTNRMDAVKVQASPSTAHSPKRRHLSQSPDSQEARRQRCAKIQKSKDALNAQMRAGYNARQDEKLHDRLRKLDSEYFELRCSSVTR